MPRAVRTDAYRLAIVGDARAPTWPPCPTVTFMGELRRRRPQAHELRYLRFLSTTDTFGQVIRSVRVGPPCRAADTGGHLSPCGTGRLPGPIRPRWLTRSLRAVDDVTFRLLGATRSPPPSAAPGRRP